MLNYNTPQNQYQISTGERHEEEACVYCLMTLDTGSYIKVFNFF